jgi:preprotein translocase subunit Sec63
VEFDPYRVLKVSRNPTPQEVEQAFRRLADIYDPSRYVGVGSGAQDEAARRLIELRRARAMLLERHKRRTPRIKVVVTPRALLITVALVFAIVAVVAIAVRFLLGA